MTQDASSRNVAGLVSMFEGTARASREAQAGVREQPAEKSTERSMHAEEEGCRRPAGCKRVAFDPVLTVHRIQHDDSEEEPEA